MREIEYSFGGRTSRVIGKARMHLLVWGICLLCVAGAWEVGAGVMVYFFSIRVDDVSVSDGFDLVWKAAAMAAIGAAFLWMGIGFLRARGRIVVGKVLGVLEVEGIVKGFFWVSPGLGVLGALVVGLAMGEGVAAAGILIAGCGVGALAWWTKRVLEGVMRERLERQTEENRGE